MISSFAVAISRRLRTFIREPLVLFFSVGFLFLIFDRHITKQQDNQAHQLVVPSALRTSPSLYNTFVEEELWLREAKRRKLGDDDRIVRRRLIQKVQILVEQESALLTPSAKQLAQYIEANKARYMLQARWSFAHIFIRKDTNAKERAEAIGRELPITGEQVTLGDAFPRGTHFRNQRESEIEQTFGATFVKTLTQAKQESWQGPFESSFGLHWIWIFRHTEEQYPSFEQIRPQALRDYIEEKKNLVHKQFLDERRKEIKIVGEPKP